jgi:hypothetical protein
VLVEANDVRHMGRARVREGLDYWLVNGAKIWLPIQLKGDRNWLTNNGVGVGQYLAARVSVWLAPTQCPNAWNI